MIEQNDDLILNIVTKMDFSNIAKDEKKLIDITNKIKDRLVEEIIKLDIEFNLKNLENSTKKVSKMLSSFYNDEHKRAVQRNRDLVKLEEDKRKQELSLFRKTIEEKYKTKDDFYNDEYKRAVQRNKDLVKNQEKSRKEELSSFRKNIEQRAKKEKTILNETLKKKHSLRKEWIAKVRGLEHKLSLETRAIHQKSLQQQIALLKTGTNVTRKEYQKRVDEIARIQGKANEAYRKMSRSAAGVFSEDSGTTFGHKLLTTAQYATAGAILYKTQEALTSLARASIQTSVQFDSSVYKMTAVLGDANKTFEENRRISTEATRSLHAYATVIGGTFKDINDAALTLGRAGIAMNEVVEATKVTAELAMLTGDSLDKSSEVVSSFTLAYSLASSEVRELGNQLTYTANASKMSIEDLGTMANYALAGASSLGLTKEEVLGLSTALSNMGVNASTIGTQIRKMGTLIRDNSTANVQFFKAIGIEQKEMLKLFQSDSPEAIKVFIQAIQGLTKDGYETASSGLEILTKQFTDSMRLVGHKAIDHIELIKKGGDDLSKLSEKMSMSMEKTLEKATNLYLWTQQEVVQSMFDSIFDRTSIETYRKDIDALRSSLFGIVAVSKIAAAEVKVVWNTIQLTFDGLILNVQKLLLSFAQLANVSSFGAYDKEVTFWKETIAESKKDIATNANDMSDAIDTMTYGYDGLVKQLEDKYQTQLKVNTALAKEKKILAEGTKDAKLSDNGSEEKLKYQRKLLKNEYEINRLKLESQTYSKNKVQLNDKDLAYYNSLMSSYDEQRKILKAKLEDAKSNANVVEREKTTKALTLELYALERQQLREKLSILKEGTVEAENELNVRAKLLNRIEDSMRSAKTSRLEQLKDIEEINRQQAINAKIDVDKLGTYDEIKAKYGEHKELLKLIADLKKSELDKATEELKVKSRLVKADAEAFLLKEKASQIVDINAKTDKNPEIKALQTQLALEDDNAKKKEISNQILAKRIAIVLQVMEAEKALAAARGDDIAVRRYDLAIAKIQAAGTATEDLTVKTVSLRNELAALDDYKILIKAEGFDEISNGIANAVNGFADLTNAQIKYAKFVEAGTEDTAKGKEAEMKMFSSQIDMYANMSSAAGSFYDEDDERKKKQEKVTKALHTVKMTAQVAEMAQSAAFTELFVLQEDVKAKAAGMTAVAMAAQSSPWTGFATAAAMIAMLASIGISLSGSGGGGGKSSSQLRQEGIDQKYNPTLEKLDKQIELLEEIARGGTAFAYEVQKASVDRQKETEEFSENIVKGYYSGKDLRVDKYLGDNMEFLFRKGNLQQADIFAKYASELFGQDISSDQYRFDEKRVAIPTVDNFSDIPKYGKLMSYLSDIGMISSGELDNIESEIEQFVTGSATSLASLGNKINDFSLTLQDSYDTLTNTDTYEQKRLNEAMVEVNKLRGETPLDKYLKDSITSFEDVGLNSKQMADLVSGDYERIMPVVEEFGDNLLKFSGEKTTQDLIDNIKNIGLVSEHFGDIASERAELQETYDLLTGVTTQREIELEALDKSNRLLQEQIWAEEDRIASQKESLEIQGQINDAWLGSLSILDQAGKQTYANNLFTEATDMTSRVSAAQKAAELGLQTSGTKEEYTKYFARLTTALETQVVGKTTTDIYEKLEEVRGEIVDLKDSQRENSINGGLYNNDAVAM